MFLWKLKGSSVRLKVDDPTLSNAESTSSLFRAVFARLAPQSVAWFSCPRPPDWDSDLPAFSGAVDSWLEVLRSEIWPEAMSNLEAKYLSIAWAGAQCIWNSRASVQNVVNKNENLNCTAFEALITSRRTASLCIAPAQGSSVEERGRMTAGAFLLLLTLSVQGGL